ncbi:hypothetical protein LX64_03794 [Chitinophaga skermanii]|uniref:CAAX prenyl protease 2/Lysostaphin resistance protein A-like domain-containing protein n=1 Tax=Chitinophaga skermanii TaxID=331697 RepID=A0A327QCI5_9BACT|nr:CPBP family intramembrane glutamic endopeptidase [Chitinophaga skermanii]RAJ01578.1 hypothetical protein LX64_03794 [Chitinophaga skermanii]
MKGKLNRIQPALQISILFTLFVIFNVVYSLLLLVLFPLLSGGVSFQEIQHLKPNQTQLLALAKWAQMGYSLFAYLLPALLFAHLTSHESTSQYFSLDRNPAPAQTTIATMVMLVALPLVGALSVWNQTWPLPESLIKTEKDLEEMTKIFLSGNSIGVLIINLLVVAIAPAISEEFLFRGAMQKVCNQWFKNGWVAVIITAAVFSAIHFQFLGFMPRFLLGILLGAIYLLSGNLWLSIIGHFVNNGLGVLTMYLVNKGMVGDAATKEQLLPWYTLIGSAVFTTGLMFLLQKVSKRKNNDGSFTVRYDN